MGWGSFSDVEEVERIVGGGQKMLLPLGGRYLNTSMAQCLRRSNSDLNLNY